jgi:glutamate formiminotransferase/formiminotetrahydrofolate cyclodeaminase
MKLVECVPNFSEGRDQVRLEQIVNEIRSVEGIQLLDVDSGKDTNRTVVTFAGSPDIIIEAAFRGIAKASEVIDMRKHTGAHPRIGATDVCPFVPFREVTMKECVKLARQLGERVGNELHIPVYLYEEAASRPGRRNLANIRSGQYEKLSEKLQQPDWKPDFGPAELNPEAGATVIGARDFLIALNVNLNTKDVHIAQEIACTIRESGRIKKDSHGQIIRDKDGSAVRIPGKFKFCKAIGWYMEEFGCAQVSINFTNFRKTPLHIVYDECCSLAENFGVRVTGSQLVGMILLEAIIQAGRYYLDKKGKGASFTESEVIRAAVFSMGFDDLCAFEPDKKVIEYGLI